MVLGPRLDRESQSLVMTPQLQAIKLLRMSNVELVHRAGNQKIRFSNGKKQRVDLKAIRPKRRNPHAPGNDDGTEFDGDADAA